MSSSIDLRIQKILDKSTGRSPFKGGVLHVKWPDRGLDRSFASGKLLPDQAIYIASVTKLFTSAVFLRLVSEKKLSLKQKISGFLPEEWMQGLHRFKGGDYSSQLTIRHLLAQTSGLPDYFEGKGPDGKSLKEVLLRGEDRSWDYGGAVALAKGQSAKFPPGKKAFYSDTNYQLLGYILERVCGKSLAEIYDEFIIAPLGLQSTYLYTDPEDGRPLPIHHKGVALAMPQAMVAFGPDGGMVSTAAELGTFLEGFITGKLFPVSWIDKIQEWHGIFFPFSYGIGIQRIRLPRIFSPFKALPVLIGHSGLNNSFAYYSAKKGMYLTGTLNEVSKPGTAVRLILGVAGL